MSTSTLPQLPAVIRSLATHIRTGMDGNDSNDQKTKKDSLATLLKDAPEDARTTFPTMDEITRVWSFENTLSEANTLAAGEEGVERMAKDKETTEFANTLNLQAGDNRREIISTVKRETVSFGKTTKGNVATRVTAVKTKGSGYADIKAFVAGRGAELL